eukprot:359240-Chlamydomonas_euryale.AAC.1
MLSSSLAVLGRRFAFWHRGGKRHGTCRGEGQPRQASPWAWQRAVSPGASDDGHRRAGVHVTDTHTK